MHNKPQDRRQHRGLIEIDGSELGHWSNWHFDHCYNDELNLAGVLRSVITAPEGGLTGFADGVEMYNDLPPALREKIEKYNVIYTLDVRRSKMRFGRPQGLRQIMTAIMLANVHEGLTFPRAMHPAVWTRPSGEKVLHISPWMAVGLEHNETPEGDALLEAVCQEMIAKAKPAYWHQWKPDHMVIWDNRRMLHAVEGCDPKYERRMQRTTIRGDYGLGYFEDGKKIGEVQREFA